MMVRVHHGSHEVSGAWVEIEHQSDRLVLDVGVARTRTGAPRAMLPTLLDTVQGSDSRLRGVLVAYPQLDVAGLLDGVPSPVPLYVGRQAAAIVSAARSVTSSKPPTTAAGYLEDRQPLHLGAFTILPQLVDHHGIDAFALVIDAGAERLVCTGPLHSHGRDVSLFERLVVNPPSNVDTLLLQGTHISIAPAVAPAQAAEETSDRGAVTESQLELDMAQAFLAAAGLAVVVSAAQHMDRLVTAYRACLRSGRTLIVDLYAATVAKATGRPTLPQPGFPQFGVYVTDRQSLAVETSGDFSRIEAAAAHRVRLGEIAVHPDEFVLLTGPSTVPELLGAGALDAHGVVVWSRAPGGLHDGAGAVMRAELASAAVLLVTHHTCGHPGDGDLSRLVTAIGARQVMMMNGGASGRADRTSRTWLGNATVSDGGWWEVAAAGAASSSRLAGRSSMVAHTG